MSSATPVRMGLIGLGWVGLNRHLPAILANKNLSLVGVADRDPEVARSVGQRYGVPYCGATRVDDVTWLEGAQAVSIATAPSAHHALIGGALRAGKHVLTEKPFCMDVPEGRELVELAAAQRLVLGIVHNFQFASSCAKLRQDIEAGSLGTVRSLGAVQWGNPGRRLPSWYESLPLGLFYDESPHLLYLLRSFAPGPLTLRHTETYASTTGHRTPACVEALYHAASPTGDIPVSLSCRFESSVSEWYLSVHGDRAVGIVDVFRDIYIKLPNDGGHGTLEVLKTSWKAMTQHLWGHVVNGPLHLSGRLLYGNDEVFRRFTQAVATGEAPQGMSGADALAVLSMQHDIVRGAVAPRS